VLSVGRRPVQRPGRNRMRAAVGCAVAAIALLAGCQASGGSTAATQAPTGSSVTVALVPGVGNAPLYVAQQEGLFRKAGLRVTIRPYPSVKAEVAALRSGSADVAFGDYADFFYAQESDVHAPVVVVADAYDAGPNVMDVLVPPGSTIGTPQDLAGKTVGTAEPQLLPHRGGSPYSLDTVAAYSVLLNDGVQPTNVTWRPMPTGDLIGALRAHQVDAILVTEPQIYEAEAQLGARAVIDACSGEAVNLPLDGYFAPASFARRHAAALTAFRSALTHAQADAPPASLHAVLTRYAGVSSQASSLITLGEYATSLNVISLQRVADMMSFYGALPRPLDVAHMVFR